MAHAYVFGWLGPSCKANARKTWNELFRKEGIDGFFDFYRTTNAYELATRLSEMFLLERRGYVIAPELQTIILPLLDRLDFTALEQGSADTVTNEGGVLVGYFCGDDERRRMDVWFGESL